MYVSPALDGAATINYESDTSPVVIRGFELDSADSIYKLKTIYMMEGYLKIEMKQSLVKSLHKSQIHPLMITLLS